MVQSLVRVAEQEHLKSISFGDKLLVALEVLLPTIAKGVLLRRRRITALAARLNVDRRAIRRLQKLRRKYGDGPLLMSLLGRQHALILSTDDLSRVLSGAPTPFTPASDEKKAALGHFEPHVSLISQGIDRTARRLMNDQVLESACPNHSLAQRFANVAEEESNSLLGYAGSTLSWDEFSPAWDRIVRRIVLGDAARDDVRLTNCLNRLRSAGNWGFLHFRNKRVFDIYTTRLNEHLARAQQGSLAEALMQIPKSQMAAPSSQATHWIFAFDAGGIAAFSALALLATHRASYERALREAEEQSTSSALPGDMLLPFLRSCVLEALRLWPTTMIVHRQSTEETAWTGGVLPKGSSLLIFAPYFHRADQRLPHANKFDPDASQVGPDKVCLPFIPFSAGPGTCPGRHVVLLTAAAMLASILRSRRIALVGGQKLSPEQELPGTLDHFSLEIELK